jgi:hypothetical protein
MTALLTFLDTHLDEIYTILTDSITRFARDPETYLSLQTMLNASRAKTEWPSAPSPQATHKITRS